MREADRIREYFGDANWRASRGRAYLEEERFELLLALIKDRGLAVDELAICDVGCGGGRDLSRWHSAGVGMGALAGTELMPARAAVARQRLPSADIRLVNGFELPFDPASFDICSASLVLSTIRHPPHRRLLLREMVRVTRTGGLLVIYDFAIRKPTNHHVTAITTSWLEGAWRPPDRIQQAAPLLPLLDVALKLPTKLSRGLVRALPRTHRLWVWKVGPSDA